MKWEVPCCRKQSAFESATAYVLPVRGGIVMNEQIVVETRNLTKIYGDGAEVRALDRPTSGDVIVNGASLALVRIVIACALANRPAIILADEPTGNLDTPNTTDIMHLLTDLNRTQVTTLIVVTQPRGRLYSSVRDHTARWQDPA
jgi:ABC-type taurine transport system ATPase subunit